MAVINLPMIDRAFQVLRCEIDQAQKQDALNTASSYLENSRLPIEAFSSADELVKTLLAKNYSVSIPGTINTKKCIDLFHSEELEKLYQSLAN